MGAVDKPRGLADFLALLELEPGDHDTGVAFRPAYYPDTGPITFIFGGQLLAQSVRAAAGTVHGDRMPHSVHAHFLRAGEPNRPYVLTVTTVREGGSFSHRRVEVGHDDDPFFVATVSFAKPRYEGAGGRVLAEYQLPIPPGAGVPGEDGPWRQQVPFASPWGAYEILEFHVPDPDADGLRPFSRRLWLRLHEDFPADDPVLSAAALAFASDLGLIVAASVTEGTADQVEGCPPASTMRCGCTGRPTSVTGTSSTWCPCRTRAPAASTRELPPARRRPGRVGGAGGADPLAPLTPVGGAARRTTTGASRTGW